MQEGGRLPTKKESPKRLKGDISILAEGVMMSNTLINSVGKAPLYFFDDTGLSLGHVVGKLKLTSRGSAEIGVPEAFFGMFSYPLILSPPLSVSTSFYLSLSSVISFFFF